MSTAALDDAAPTVDLTANGELDRDAVAAWLAELAESLRQSDDIDVEFGDDRYRIAVAHRVELDVELVAGATGTRLAIELSW